ncbi:hypothetical protein EZV62_011463 [Acer yangbiense]|uniref:CCHC-type domain-containing protein n=1 Tax=Acer yangbiense TaxID=1000413 RepID=A0A5C7I6N8_9ROSI|nr:hypothetical protein EZV62_011463 [Acer yangbiense]
MVSMEQVDIANLCASLSISDKDGPVRILEENLRSEAVIRQSLSRIGKILSNKTVNRVAFMRVIMSIWQVKEGFEIESVTGNIFTFHFKNEEDQRRVILGGPWSFDDALMVFAKSEGKGRIESIQFKEAEFWVQIHQVPILCMTKKIGWFLGSMIEEVVEVDGGNSGEAGGKFLRARVKVDIMKPLRRCLRIDVLGDGEESVMLLRYERLPNHCFRCGMVDHCTYECPVVKPKLGTNESEIFQFGLWLRAPFFLNRNRERDKSFQQPPVIGGNWGSNQLTKLQLNKEDNNGFKTQVDGQEVTSRGRNVGAREKSISESKSRKPLNENNIEGNKMETEEVIMKGNNEVSLDTAFNAIDTAPIRDDVEGHIRTHGLKVNRGPDGALDSIRIPLKEVLGLEGRAFNGSYGVLGQSNITGHRDGDGEMNGTWYSGITGETNLLNGDKESKIRKRWVRKIKDSTFGEIGEAQSVEVRGKREATTDVSRVDKRKCAKVDFQVEMSRQEEENKDVGSLQSEVIRRNNGSGIERYECENESSNDATGSATRSEGSSPVVKDICPWCKKGSETTYHALWDCKIFKRARKRWLPNKIILRDKYKLFFDLILDCYTLLNGVELELFCVAVWRVWFLRNALVHRAPMADVCEVFDWALCFLAEYKNCQADIPL